MKDLDRLRTRFGNGKCGAKKLSRMTNMTLNDAKRIIIDGVQPTPQQRSKIDRAKTHH